MRVTYDFEVSDFHRLRVTTLHGAYHEVCIGLCALSYVLVIRFDIALDRYRITCNIIPDFCLFK